MGIKDLLRLGYGMIPSRIRPIARRSYGALIGEHQELIRYYRNNDRPADDLRDKLESRYYWFVDNFILRIPQRRQVSYLTHIPVLLALGEHCQVRRVLELGCGIYSTLALLDKECFPEIERLDSIENHADWGEKVRQSAGGDERLNLQVIAGAMADGVKSLDLESYDLIFVDDSLTTGGRSRTIHSLTFVRRPIVVIHDYDTPVYRLSITHIFSGALPFVNLG